MNDLKYQIHEPNGAVFCLFASDGQKTLSWAWCEYIPEPDDTATIKERLNRINLLDIITPPSHQRKGYASKVIKMLQDVHNEIISNADRITSPGAQLMLKNGFKHIKAIHKKEVDTYAWKRKNSQNTKEKDA